MALGRQQLDMFVDRGECEFRRGGLEDCDLLGNPHGLMTSPGKCMRANMWVTSATTRLTGSTIHWNGEAAAKIADRAGGTNGSTPGIRIDVMRICDIPLRGGKGDHGETGQLRDENHRRQPGLQAVCAKTAERSRVSRRDASDGGPVKSHFRMARTSTTVGDVKIPAGTTVMLLARSEQPG